MNILAITTVRNEAPHLIEWIAYHRAIGVEDFLIYSNDCSDGTEELLDALGALGIVTHVRHSLADGSSIQWQAMNAAAKHQRYKSADWVLVSDCDEFLTLSEEYDDLVGFISRLPAGTDAIAVPWRLYGSNGHENYSDDLTIERFTRASTPDISLPLAHFFKSLFRPKSFQKPGIHRPKRRKSEKPNWLGPARQPLPGPFAEADNRINLFGMPRMGDVIQMNHYSVRSAAEFILKRQRGLPNHTKKEIGLGYWVERNFNDVVDRSALRMLDRTRKEMTNLVSNSDVRQAVDAARQYHIAEFDRLMKDQENIQLFWQLVLAGDSHAPDASQALKHARRLNNATNSNDG